MYAVQCRQLYFLNPIIMIGEQNLNGIWHTCIHTVVAAFKTTQILMVLFKS